MHDPLTSLGLIVLTLVAFAASVIAIRRLRKPDADRAAMARTEHGLTWACAIGGSAIFLYQALVVNRGWQPLEAHVDGLVLIAVLFAAMILFLQRRPRLEVIGAFGLPLLTVMLAWAVCASAWTYRPFHINSLWHLVHLTGVYLGTLFAAVAAIAGVMFLYVQHRLRQKQDLTANVGRFASLESLELLIIRTAMLGFVLLSLGLATGLIIITATSTTRLGEGWWHSPKVVLATAAWLTYAVVMNVRFGSSFRGARAAWLSIAGLLLLLVTYGVVNAGPENAPAVAPESAVTIAVPFKAAAVAAPRSAEVLP